MNKDDQESPNWFPIHTALIDNAPMIDTVNSPYIHVATSDNFSSLVLENSNKGPVLVNFWSRKAGPCLRLYPVLDQLTHHYAGRVLLINVDTENEFVFTREYGIASVPTLKLFRNGQVVETLHGYQSEKDLTRMLDLYVSRDSDATLGKAIQLYSEGEQSKAFEMLADAVVEDQENPRLPLTLCKLLKHEGRYVEAIKLIQSLPDMVRQNREVRQLEYILEFYNEEDIANDLATLQITSEQEPDNINVKRALVSQHVLVQEFEQALQELVLIMQQDLTYQDNYAQQAMLKIFNILGDGHPLIRQFRPNLQRYNH